MSRDHFLGESVMFNEILKDAHKEYLRKCSFANICDKMNFMLLLGKYILMYNKNYRYNNPMCSESIDAIIFILLRYVIYSI